MTKKQWINIANEFTESYLSKLKDEVISDEDFSKCIKKTIDKYNLTMLLIREKPNTIFFINEQDNFYIHGTFYPDTKIDLIEFSNNKEKTDFYKNIRKQLYKKFS